MLLIDLSAVVTHSCINLHKDLNGEEVDVNVVRHVAMSSLLYYKRKFSRVYGKPIICVDRKPYWRESVFPHYKKNRKASRDKSNIDWAAFSKNFKEIQPDIRDYCPYPYVEVARCEADDSIAILAQYGYARKEPIAIVSSDKDLIQLQNRYPGIKQWSPKRNKYITQKDNEYDLLTHIIKGDSSDGIPNIFSPDDVLITEGTRQKTVSAKMLEAAHACDDPLDFCETDEIKKKFKRNRLIIDLNRIPDRIVDKVIAAYEAEIAEKKPNRMMACVRKYRMRNLLDSAKDF